MAKIKTAVVVVFNVVMLPLYLTAAIMVIGIGLPFIVAWWLITFLFGE